MDDSTSTDCTRSQIKISEHHPFRFDFSQLNLEGQCLSTGPYPITNESTDQIVAALSPDKESRLLCILGGGDQTLGLLEKISSGTVQGIDHNPVQVALSAIKIELISLLDQQQYLALLQGDIKENEKEEIKKHLKKAPLIVHPYLDSALELLDKINPEELSRIGFLWNKNRYQKIKDHFSEIECYQAEMVDYLENLSADNFDSIYISNIFDYLEPKNENKFLKNLRRVVKPKGKIYSSTLCPNPDFFEVFKAYFSEDEKAYQEGLKNTQKKVLGSPQGLGNFFVGIKI
ncbi:MAG: class I SAM-dependent methyltransferase [Nanoarchaeota archaeon]|nr:class I SAM-dependent methyltransferase [Nanoarchaeota archaeon]MBU1644671.1 class I SAM-dependent methyltransferase [Nanoarchaeota archaeon]MBU1976566.1 class I SAM-dependent methyltransferase [Nanoarchaeota archaeon]